MILIIYTTKALKRVMGEIAKILRMIIVIYFFPCCRKNLSK